MITVKAHVRNGRLVVDEPTGLGEGSKVALVVVDASDDLDEEERARLHAALREALTQVDAGDTIPAAEVLDSLGRRPP